MYSMYNMYICTCYVQYMYLLCLLVYSITSCLFCHCLLIPSLSLLSAFSTLYVRASKSNLLYSNVCINYLLYLIYTLWMKCIHVSVSYVSIVSCVPWLWVSSFSNELLCNYSNAEFQLKLYVMDIVSAASNHNRPLREIPSRGRLVIIFNGMHISIHGSIV